MNRLNTFSIAAALSGVIAAPALAGSIGEPSPDPVIAAPVVQTAPQGGDWTGAWVGARLGYADGDVEGTGASGETYGLGAGYDYDFGTFVLGGGIDYDAANVDLSGGAGSIDNIARLKLRAGYDLGQTLIYATGGAARAEATIGGVDFSDNGYFGGIGAEHRLTDRWSVGGEVLLHKFDDFDGTGQDVDATTANVSANFRF